VSPNRVKRFVGACRGLAAILAVALLLCELLATNGQIHGALHHNGKTASNTCVLCLFVKGMVDLPESEPVVNGPALIWFESMPRVESIFLADFSFLTSPSRAPPAVASFQPVVA
jgi:hypothetical protein